MSSHACALNLVNLTTNGQALTPRFGGDNAGLGGVVLSGGSKVTWLKTHNMAHTILVRLDVDDEYADIPPDITAMDYLEGSKAHGWEVVTERVFTESEVRAMLRAIRHELEMNVRWQDHVEVVSASAMRQAFHRSDVLSLDPA